jgi:glycosyltransferase involved in cell wall biosynthesis
VKLLYVHHVGDLYGASRSLLRLTSALHQQGHQVRVVLQEDGPLREALTRAGVPVELLPCLPVLHRNRLRSPAAWLRLARDVARARRELGRLMDSFQPDIVHSNGATILPVAGFCARARGIPHVLHIREFFTEFGRAWRLYERVLARASDRIVCVSAAVARQFHPSVQPRVRVIHNGFPPDEFARVTPGLSAAWRARWSPGPGPVAGVVGRVKLRRKGQETFLAAAALLRERFPAARFLIVGAPFPGNEEHLDALHRQARELGVQDCVVFTGEVEDGQAALAALDVVVLPSGQPEPFGGVVIEAMALGRPVVGTAIGGTPEQIEEGVTGLLVPPGDPAALAQALARLFEDAALRTRMGEAARRRFQSHFTFAPFQQKVLDLYRELTE